MNVCIDVQERIRRSAKKGFAGKFTHLEFRFRADLCYIDSYCDQAIRTEALPAVGTKERAEYLKAHDDKVTHLCRLRYLGDPDKWGFEFFSYSSERYDAGGCLANPEQAFVFGKIKGCQFFDFGNRNGGH
jgi:hypothetical protein